VNRAVVQGTLEKVTADLPATPPASSRSQVRWQKPKRRPVSRLSSQPLELECSDNEQSAILSSEDFADASP
jgi:hypothetical protein